MYAALILDPIARNAAATKSRPTGPGSEEIKTHTSPPSFPVPSHSTLNFTIYAPPSSTPLRSLIAPSAQTPTNGKIPALIEREQRNANRAGQLAGKPRHPIASGPRMPVPSAASDWTSARRYLPTPSGSPPPPLTAAAPLVNPSHGARQLVAVAVVAVQTLAGPR